jgi:hypothetical protein
MFRFIAGRAHIRIRYLFVKKAGRTNLLTCAHHFVQLCDHVIGLKVG